MTADACGTMTVIDEPTPSRPTIDQAVAQGKLLDISHLVEPMGLLCRCVVLADSLDAFPDEMPEFFRRMSLMPIMEVVIDAIRRNPGEGAWSLVNESARLVVRADLAEDPARMERVLIVGIRRI